jgi:coenzyme F420 biosynthesis associated uncharacterized protein
LTFVTTTSSPLALRVANRFMGSYPLAGTYHERRFAEEAPGLVERSAALVEAETGLCAPGSPDVQVVSRAEWVQNNMSAFSALVAPAEEQLGRHSAVTRRSGQRVMAAEMGAVLGILSRRVLGQYELVLPTEDGGLGDTVMFVGANVLHMERRHVLRPSEFRFWVALHECTHRAQFRGVAWMREYFLGLVGELVAKTEPEPRRVSRVATELRAASAAGDPLIGEAGLFGMFATPAQREIIGRVQALMSLLEGHGHVVMDRIGGRELVTQDRMSKVLKARRMDRRTATFFRLVGLELKLKQYEAGARFVAGVERHAGWAALDAAWKGPENLPTLDEITNPVLWLERVG